MLSRSAALHGRSPRCSGADVSHLMVTEALTLDRHVAGYPDSFRPLCGVWAMPEGEEHHRLRESGSRVGLRPSMRPRADMTVESSTVMRRLRFPGLLRRYTCTGLRRLETLVMCSTAVLLFLWNTVAVKHWGVTVNGPGRGQWRASAHEGAHLE